LKHETFTNKEHAGSGDKPPPAHLLKRWMLLFLAVLLIAGFVVIAPFLETLPLIGKPIQVLRESDIEVGAWYYDDVKEVAEAERFMRRALKHDSPGRK
jgi:hypothetical protein